jgi:organic anion transporter 4A
VAGLSAFLPKFLEQQFHLSSGTAAQLMGLVVVPAGGLGTFIGGWAIHRLGLTRSQIIKMCVVAQLVGLPVVAVYLMGCPTPSYSGFSSPDCRASCSCPDNLLDPVCGSDSLTYLSPCHAGCSSITNSTGFSDCSCVAGGSAIRDICPTSCNLLVPFLLVMFVNVFITFIVVPPLLIAGMRSVDASEQSLEVGLQTVLSSLVGNIPGPVAFGYSLDRACLLWDHSCSKLPIRIYAHPCHQMEGARALCTTTGRWA